MPASRRFEGPDLEGLLHQIEQQAGPRAQIVKVEKVRSGGMLGFFAKEHFEAEVVPGPAEEPAPPENPSPSKGEQPGVPSAEAKPGAPDEGPRTLEDLVDAVSHAEVVAADPTPPVRSFAQMLEDFSSDFGAEASTPEADTAGAPGPAATEAAASVAQITAPAGPPPELAPRPARVGARRDDWLTEDAGAARDDLTVEADSEVPGTRPALAPSPKPARAPQRDARDADKLLQLGLPPRLVPVTDEGEATFGALVRNLAGLPEAPPLPTEGGEIVAVVGDLDRARHVAAGICQTVGTDPEGIVFACRSGELDDAPSWMVLEGPEVAEKRRRAWRRRDHVIVVALDAGVSQWQQSWAHDMLVALEPAMVWAVAPASAKVEDTGAWLDALGGADAVVLDDLAGTTSPAAHIGLGVPIAKLDDAPATAEAWALLLAARLAAGEPEGGRQR